VTDGKGVDVILNPLGGSTIDRDLDCLAPFGRLLVYGQLSGNPVQISPEILHQTNRTVIGFSFGHYRRNRPEMVRGTVNRVIDLLEDNRLDILIAKSFPLEDASASHRYIEERKVIGKIVLIPDSRD
jgi:NADPH2:quinone reductase